MIWHVPSHLTYERRQAAPDKTGMRTLGMPEEFGGTPDAWAAEVRASIARWAEVVKQANIKTE